MPLLPFASFTNILRSGSRYGSLALSLGLLPASLAQDEHSMPKISLTTNSVSFHHAAGKDLALLLDGVETDNLDDKAVGWEFAGQIVLGVDLGVLRQIGEIALTGLVNPSSGSQYPERIVALASEDGKIFRQIGDLALDKSKLPVENGLYHSCLYRLGDIGMKARYLKIIVIPRGLTFFASELKVLDGSQTVAEVDKYPKVDNVDALSLQLSTELHARRRIQDDFQRAKSDVLQAVKDSNTLKADEKRDIYQQIALVEEQVSRDKIAVKDPLVFKTILPFNDAHASVYALYGLLPDKSGKSGVELSTPHRWDPIAPNISVTPAGITRDLKVAAFGGESRADAFLLSNRSVKSETVSLSLVGPALPWKDSIHVFQAEWSDTKKSEIVATALLPLNQENGVWTVEIPAGMNRLVWVQFTPQKNSSDHQWKGKVKVSSGGKTQDLPIELDVFRGNWPEQLTLNSGGWDYVLEALPGQAATGMEGAGKDLPAKVRDFLTAAHTDTPWAVGLLDYGKYDEEGKMISPPSVVQFDQWIAFWPNARRYGIFSNSLGEIDGKKMGTPAFDRAVREWAQFWSDHIKSLGLKQEIILLLVDEPGLHEGQEDYASNWATLVKSSTSRFVLWSNSVFKNPNEADPTLWKDMDILCPLRTQLIEKPPGFETFYREKQKEGKRLELYSCDGPAFELDPYSYYKLQAWSIHDMGATASTFWQLANFRYQGLSWNEYINHYIDYVPFFIGKDGVHSARQMEALKEGLQDYEYFLILSRLIEANKDNPAADKDVAAAKKVLESVRSVLDAKDAEKTKWAVPKDRSRADESIREAGRLISKLSGSSSE